MPQTAPLSEQEFVELDTFLLSEACDEETLSIEEAHGYLTALIVGAESLTQPKWLEAIWGKPNFADETQTQRMTDLLVRMYRSIEENLREDEPFEPLVVEEEEEGEVMESYEGWCFGFMAGVQEFEDVWQPLPKEAQALLTPIAQLALLATGDEPEMDESEYHDWVELLPGAVTGLYQFWHGGHS